MELNARNKQVLLIAALWIAGLFLGWVFFLGADLQKLSLAKAAKREDAEKQAVLRNITQLEAERETYRQQLAQTSDVSWLVEMLSRISKKTGVKITSIVPLESQRVRRYEKISLRLKAVCGYHELGNFVSQIENYDKLVKASEMNVQRQGGPAASTALDVTLVLSTFHAL